MITSHRTIALLMAREIDPQDAPGDEYIHEWVPQHNHDDYDGGPNCAACWMHDYDKATKP